MPGIARKNKHDHERKHRMAQTELNWVQKGNYPLVLTLNHLNPFSALYTSVVTSTHRSNSMMHERLMFVALCFKRQHISDNLLLILKLHQ